MKKGSDYSIPTDMGLMHQSVEEGQQPVPGTKNVSRHTDHLWTEVSWILVLGYKYGKYSCERVTISSSRVSVSMPQHSSITAGGKKTYYPTNICTQN